LHRESGWVRIDNFELVKINTFKLWSSFSHRFSVIIGHRIVRITANPGSAGLKRNENEQGLPL
jgi:hypothetical protein